MKKFNQFREDSLLEVLKASDPTGKWISDFVHSDNPKFAGKSKKERIQMALGASYASKRNEEVDLEEAIKLGSKVKMHSPGKDYHEQEGHVGEIRHGLYKGAPKKYTIDYGNGKSVQLGKSNIKHQTPDKWHAEENNHWHDAGKQDAENGKRPNPRTYLKTLKDKQAKHPEEVYFYMNGYKSVKPGVAEEASPMIKPPLNRFDNKKEAFTHAKTHGGKVFRSTYIDPNTGNKNITFVVKKEQGVAEAKDSREYDYEGDMAKSQLRSIIANAQRAHDMLEDDTNMAEWVQSKITLAADYISTVADYMQSEVKEEVEELDELSKSTLASYAKSASRSATIKRKIAADFENKGARAKSPGMKAANAKLSKDYKEKSWKRQDSVNKAIDRLAKEEVEPIEELNKDTLYSYINKADKQIDAKHKVLGPQIKAGNTKAANKTSAIIGKRMTGMDRAETRLNKEDTEVAEARMSAAQRLWNAEQKQRAKSDASLARTPSSIPKPEEKK